MIVIFDRQHFGKPNRNDRGAGVDLDNDGDIENNETEAYITPYYYLPAKSKLESCGHSVFVFDDGYYSARHQQANALARANPNQTVLYLACHINAGRGDYSVFIHDSRSSAGKVLADLLATAFKEREFDGISRSLVRSGSSNNDWKNAYYTIKDIFNGPTNICGVCVEPFFLDTEAHQQYATTEGGAQIGLALVDGIMRW